jgi:hypothetical protein
MGNHKSRTSVIRHSLIRNTTGQQLLVFAVAAFGVICRLTQYLVDSSLWYDESFVALNVIHKSFGALFGPLDWNEASPPGFLAAEKLIVSIFGISEYALRLLPLIAALAALLLFAPLARRLCGNGPAMLWALILFAAWPVAISQAGTLKHFSLDILLSIVLFLLALPACETQPDPARLALWGAVGASGVWLSFATVFTFAGTCFVMAAQALRGWPARQRIAFVAANLMTLISLTALTGPALAQRSAGLMDYWTRSGAFSDGSGAIGLALWLARSLLAFCAYFWRAPGWIILPIAAVGVGSFWHANLRRTTMMLLVPILLAIAASFAHLWPLGGNQHMAFAAPAMLLIVGQGCETIRCWLSERRRWLGEAALAALLAPVLVNSSYRAISPRRNADLRSVVEFLRQRRLPSDVVIASDAATVDFYTGYDFRYDSPPITPSARLWFISIPGVKPRGLDDILNRRPLLARAESGGAAACLFGPQTTGQHVDTHR